jgi:thiamine pyrophosphokinase
MAKKAVIFANGELIDGALIKSFINPGDFIIAADGGHLHIKSLGLQPDLMIGDLDSLPAEERQALLDAHVPIKPFQVEKDETDLELALAEAVKLGFTKILVVAALGGRLDQTLGNLALLHAPFLVNCDIYLDDGLTRVWLLTNQRYPNGLQIEGQPGERVSLIALQTTAKGISTVGLKFPLVHEDLKQYETRGISNEMLGKSSQIHIEDGMLLVIHSRNSMERKGR